MFLCDLAEVSTLNRPEWKLKEHEMFEQSTENGRKRKRFDFFFFWFSEPHNTLDYAASSSIE